MEDKITVQKEDILNAYKQASEEQKTLLENMFGKDMFQPQDIKERVKTFDDACEVLGEEHPLVKEYRGVENINFDFTQDIIAYIKLRIISAALNEGWEPQFTKNECRWYPWFILCTEEKMKDKSDEYKASHTRASNCRLVFDESYRAWTNSPLPYSARLTVKSVELADYFGKQFIDIWADFLYS